MISLGNSPKPDELLYTNLFVCRSTEETFQILSDGLSAVVKNASRLLEDVILLVNAERFSSGSFLLATADEEIAKFYILVDMCRLDFRRHSSNLKCLCRAFYSHVQKFAYNKVIRFGKLHDMAHAREVWRLGVTKWCPSTDPQSGEPDMPHETYFTREMPLYVDFIDLDQAWSVPNTETRRYGFEPLFGTDDLSRSQEALKQLEIAHAERLCSPEALSVLNEICSRKYINENFLENHIWGMYKKVAERLEEQLDIPKDTFLSSALSAWPLYHFVTLPC